MDGKAMIAVSVGDIKFKVIEDEHSGVWTQINDGLWEPDTFEVFRSVLQNDRSYVDIGAWKGPTCLYGAQLSRKCWAIEPDPVAFDMLEKNIEINQITNISTHRVAIFDESGTIRMGSTNAYLGDSCTTYLRPNVQSSVDVDAVTLQEFFDKNQIDDCNFIKMDVEGAEVKIIPAVANFLKSLNCGLHLSLHSGLFYDKKKYFQSMIEPLEGIYQRAYFSSDISKPDYISSIKNHSGWDSVFLPAKG